LEIELITMPVKIVMVCLGNICRSPLAEGILASKLPKDTFIVDSAGTGSWHIGKHPDERSIATAKKNGLDISNQKAKHFNATFFEEFDYIYVMDSSNYSDVTSLAKTEAEKKKVKLVLEELNSIGKTDVPDPYYGGQNGFDLVYKMLNEATDILAKKLIEKHS
jgi:protein-tyrosine phosphatase